MYVLIGEMPGSLKRLYECSCGAVVSNQEKHDRFHEELRRVAHQAGHADSMIRPLG